MIKNKNGKNQDMCRLRNLISQDVKFTRLCLLNLLIKIIFLFNQMIIKIDTH